MSGTRDRTARPRGGVAADAVGSLFRSTESGGAASPSPAAASATGPAAARPPRILCLGGAMVELICERHTAGPADADVFVPHLGGAVAGAAIHAARHGAEVALAGAAGDDEWGAWLRDQLGREGVEVDRFVLAVGTRTAIALVTIDERGGVHRAMYGEEPGVPPGLEAAIATSSALFFGSDSLIGDEQRALTMRARELALAQDCHVIFDPNLRLDRWTTRASAQAAANACVPGALLVRVNALEATVMTGEDDPERAATALVKAGARMVAITLGDDGAILRGEFRADVRAVEAHVISTIGSGDAFTGVLLAQLGKSGFYPPAVPASMRQAATAAAKACERWGAVD